MARYIKQGTIRDGLGNVISGATVYVYLGGTTTAASVYAAVSGGTAVNSVETDTDGSFSFYVDTDDYDRDQSFKLVISKTGYTSQTWDYEYIILENIKDGVVINDGTSTTSAIAIFSDDLGKTIETSGVLIDASDNITGVTSMVVEGNLYLSDEGGEYISGDGTDLTLTSSAKINLTAVSDVIVPVNVGIILGDGAEKIESNNTDLTVNSGGAINLTATTDVVIPANVGVTFGTGEKIEGDNTDLTVTSGGAINLTATTDVVIPANVGVTFGDDGEKIEGDGTNLTIASSGILNLNSTGALVASHQAITDNHVLTVDQVGAADNDYAKFTANGIEGRSYTEVKQDLDLEIGIDVAAQTHASQHAVSGADTVFPADPGADKYLMWDNDTGVLVWADAVGGGGGGDVATDTIWDAAGDLAVGTGANTAAKVNIGAEEVVARIGAGNIDGIAMAEQTVLGRLTGGSIAAVTVGIADNNIVQIDSADVADNEYARFTANGLEGRTSSEVYTDLLSQVLLENDAIKLDAALSADGKYNGITRTGTAGATLAFGDVCYFAVADNRWKLANADSAAKAQGLLGICVLAAANDGDATNILLIGMVRADTAFPSFTVGAPVFLSTTDGDLSSTAPSGTGDIIRIVGQAWTANELWFCPSPDFFEYKA